MPSRFWDHVAMTPGRPPQVGTSSVMKGKHAAPKWVAARPDTAGTGMVRASRCRKLVSSQRFTRHRQSQPEMNWYMYQPGFSAGAAMSIAARCSELLLLPRPLYRTVHT
jgi:hypothetical protein